MSTNAKLGQEVHQHLLKLGIETPMVAKKDRKNVLDECCVQGAFHDVLRTIGLDLKDDSLRDTPKRVAKMYMQEIFKGLDYNNFPKCSTFANKMKADEMVCVKSILVRSVCEHHLVPFIGVAHVAYIPQNHIIGLSKFNRLVDFFCRRPQVQERLTEQLAATFAYVLGTKDVAVVVQAEHMCVKLRGIQDPHSETVTSKMSGRFRTNLALRNEFLHLIK